jgi:hypothetical protein
LWDEQGENCGTDDGENGVDDRTRQTAVRAGVLRLSKPIGETPESAE